jgi:hypothetical protein
MQKWEALWKTVPKDDKPVLLSHLNKMGLMWLDAKTLEKHKQTIPTKYAHFLGNMNLLGNTMGPKPKAGKSMMLNW